ncbi:hypothetical protein A9G13_02135 [Gilliamella sp. wkB178]|uniref:DUF968 domain-containing protein n=1 Tax=Gilliamella sp. wkB178 TaxID=3120259 RepID=UPI00080DE19A|nr:DUF968 domain-containing protein [Gilliamella apicola]OCG08883.1 hypothetical protein A9G13_02135 [Gilliamella apicola]
MKAILTPYYQPELGLIILKPGTELLKKLSTGNRIIISQTEDEHSGTKSGIIQNAQPLLTNKYIDPFILHDAVVNKLKNLYSFDKWLNNRFNCQLKDGKYCYHEFVNEKIGNSAIHICWHHNKDLVIDDRIKTIANRNLKSFLIDCIIKELELGNNHQLSIQELAWWSVINNLYEYIPESMARLLHNRPIEQIQSVYKESDLIASDDRSGPRLINEINRAYQHLQKLEKTIKTITVDPESPESFMLRPKMKRWESTKYLQWVKTQPCVCCGQQSDDPHHIIGYGQGKMGGKAHDIFTIPLCRKHHNELHKNVEEWEQKHGSQILLLVQFLDRVFGMKVIQ